MLEVVRAVLSAILVKRNHSEQYNPVKFTRTAARTVHVEECR